MIDNMERISERFEEIGRELSSPEVLSNPQLLSKVARERSALEPKVDAYRRYLEILDQLESTREMLGEETDRDMLELARAERDSLEEECAELEERLKLMILPDDPLDDRDIIMEIRAGTGGDEAALFAGDLYRMYTHFADIKGWKTDVLSSTPSEIGGFKEVIFSVSGDRVYSILKYESGVHRVQRVPVTESSGRIHTSAASVAVLPEAEDLSIDISQNDLKIDVYRSSGPGGQSVNTTDSAVRITHIPTGMIVTCQDEKSQHKNKAKAMKVLKARLLDRAREDQERERTLARRSMVSTGDRSAKIRTYNFPQNRVTDHRINLTVHNLDEILAGGLNEFIEAIRLEDRKKTLEAQSKAAAK
ncbi:MAG: peptide chain release factor 1 [Candidatus Latescibacteria bacterium]|nr:peptide chain release factor 1 [Candidatus Latescibacterota bacterium]